MKNNHGQSKPRPIGWKVVDPVTNGEAQLVAFGLGRVRSYGPSRKPQSRALRAGIRNVAAIRNVFERNRLPSRGPHPCIILRVPPTLPPPWAPLGRPGAPNVGSAPRHCQGERAIDLLGAVVEAVDRGVPTAALGRAARSWGGQFSEPSDAVAELTCLLGVLLTRGPEGPAGSPQVSGNPDTRRGQSRREPARDFGPADDRSG